MRRLPFAHQVYMGGLAVVGLLILAIYFPALTHTALSQIVLALAAALAIAVAETYRIPLSDKKAVTVTVGISFATILLLSTASAIWTTAVGMTIASGYLVFYRKRFPWYTGTFNVGTYVLSVALAAFAYWRIGPAQPDLLSWASVVSLSAAAVIYFSVNSVLVAGVVALRQNLAAWSVWVSIAQEVAAEYFGLILLGIIIAATFEHVPWALPLLLVPLIVLYYSLKKHQAPSEGISSN